MNIYVIEQYFWRRINIGFLTDACKHIFNNALKATSVVKVATKIMLLQTCIMGQTNEQLLHKDCFNIFLHITITP